MEDWVEVSASEAHRKREREKARKLRQSAYFQNLLNQGKCHFCKKSFPATELTIDHLVPISRGGRSTRGNMVVCCKKCNSDKKYYTPAELIMNEEKSKIQVVADDKIPFLRGVFEPHGNAVYLPGSKIGSGDLNQAQILLTRTRTKVNQALLGESSVRFVGSATIGFDHIDTEYLDRAGIKWSNAPGCNSSSVAQYICSALLNLEVPLAGKTLGVVGVGNVGSKVVKVARALGMEVLANDPPRVRNEGITDFVELDFLLRESDFVTLHLPLDESTRNIADGEFFAKMKKSAYFLNSSRGEVVDEAALKQAKIAGFVLDVWCNEPEIDQELMAQAIFATPHIAGYSLDGKANGTSFVVRLAADILNIPSLLNYYPENIPLPPNPVIKLPDSGEVLALIRNAVNQSYDIREDDRRLRNSPELFEELRGNYPLRREFPAFTLSGGSPEIRDTLAGLGFN